MKFLFLFLFFVPATIAYAEPALLLYAEDGQFLGCINCNQISESSIWNELGKYGSVISSTSIWNELGVYGSEIGRYSPFNEITNSPPKIVDEKGRLYGYLTINPLKTKRSTISLAERIISTKGKRNKINIR